MSGVSGERGEGGRHHVVHADRAAPLDAFDRLIAESLPHHDATTERWLPTLLARRGVRAVIYYGSCLHAVPGSGSEPDFYLVVDSLLGYHGTLAEALLNAVLPPGTYHARLDGAQAVEHAKLCVVSTAQLLRETSPRASDLHHLGRLSKRVALIHARDADAARLVARARRSALETLTPYVLALLGERFGRDDFLRALLAISYQGEARVVEPGKVEQLFDADREHYRAVAHFLLDQRPGVLPIAGDRYLQARPSFVARRAAFALIHRSRLRSLLRWPKSLLTFDGWLDYALHKIERHTGRVLPLSERQRRHPLVYGWPTLLALRREGLLR